MKIAQRMLVVLIAVFILGGLLPCLETDTDAAATPVLVLRSTTAVNPVLEHILDFDTYKSGGPFNVTFEWKAVNIRDNDPTAANASCGIVSVVGSVYGSMTQQQNEPHIYTWGNTGWVSQRFSFQNVGVCSNGGVTTPGNLLRFSMWKAKGELHIKNLVIKNAAGTVLYNLNTDPAVAQAVRNTEAMGNTECDLSELEAISDDICPWTASQISTGDYSAYLRFETGSNPSTTTKPTTQTNHNNPCTSGHTYQNGYCIYCFTIDPNYNPCANGHTYENGWCVFCLAPDPVGCDRGEHIFDSGYCLICFAFDPNYVPSSTTVPTPTPPTASVQFPDHYYPINPSVDNDRDESDNEDDDRSSKRKNDNDFSIDGDLLIKIAILIGGILVIGSGFFFVMYWVRKK